MSEPRAPLSAPREVEIVQLLASDIHRYEGRPADGPRFVSGVELRESLEFRAGRGIVGDRYFNERAHRHASVTFQAVESLEAIERELALDETPGLRQTRRNILLRGVDIDTMRGTDFSLDSGDGPVLFRANRPANPCAWMDVAIAPGAFPALRRRGGMRCEPLGDGVLRVGRAVLRSTLEPAAASVLF